MRVAEIREQQDEELRRQEREARQELFNLRFQLATGRGANTSRIGALRRDVARIRTVLRERELSQEQG